MPEIVQGNPVNEATPKPVRTSSHMEFNAPLFGTYRFGEYGVNAYFEGVPDDRNLRIQSVHNLRSFTLGAPLMSDIKLMKDYFRINMKCLLPMNWEKIYVNPTIGEDVDASLVNTTFLNCLKQIDDASKLLTSNFGTLADAFHDALVNQDASYDDTTQVPLLVSTWLAYLIFMEKFFSNGSLLASLGIHLSKHWWYINNDYDGGMLGYQDFDWYFDQVIGVLKNSLWPEGYEERPLQFALIDGTLCNVSLSVPDNNYKKQISFNEFLSLVRDIGISLSGTTAWTDGTYQPRTLDDACVRFRPGAYCHINISYELNLNLKKVYSYQLVCAHYYSNDKVDYIYSAELYRQLIRSYTSAVELLSGIAMEDWFDLNGIHYHYDFLSGLYLNKMFAFAAGDFHDSYQPAYQTTLQNWSTHFQPYVNAVFSFRNSLRFVDYFTGSRTQPLAVGDTNVAVNNNHVSVIDTVQKTMMARFLNAVNRGKRLAREYISNIFNITPNVDPHDPLWLGQTQDVIYSSETENTGEAQQTQANSITSNLRSNASQFAFETDIDEPCVILGICYFDIPRSYWQTIERENFHIDRFDMFNPYMQFIGDQSVYRAEIGALTNPMDPFSYQLRHAEFKQKYPQCFGGFVDYLPGWTFKASPVEFDNIDDRFIRSTPAELDRFYVSLTGSGLASYFHFVIKNVNMISVDRPMVKSPSIL